MKKLLGETRETAKRKWREVMTPLSLMIPGMGLWLQVSRLMERERRGCVAMFWVWGLRVNRWRDEISCITGGRGRKKLKWCYWGVEHKEFDKRVHACDRMGCCTMNSMKKKRMERRVNNMLSPRNQNRLRLSIPFLKKRVVEGKINFSPHGNYYPNTYMHPSISRMQTKHVKPIEGDLWSNGLSKHTDREAHRFLEQSVYKLENTLTQTSLFF